MAWKQVNPHGSGFQNAGAVGPWSGHDNVALSGGDTAGIHKSTDRGSTFANRDASITGVDAHIASIEPHPTQAGRFFALGGNGTAGSLFESTDYGDTWTDVSSGTPAVFGDGALLGNSGTASLLGPGHGEHPRSVGRLIAVDAAGGYIYVATFKSGVYRGTLGASSGVSAWTRIGLAPSGGTTAYYCRGAVYDATNDVLYVSTFKDPGSSFDCQSGRIWRITSPHAGSPTIAELGASPLCSSAMLLIGDRLYTVAHPITANLTYEGLWYLDSAHSATPTHVWTKIAALPTSGSERWMSLDGYKVGGTTTLWCGSASMGTHSLCKVTDASGTWQGTIYPTSLATTINDMGGPNTPADPWWMYTARNGMMLGRSVFVASTIRINPQNTQEIYVFGRSGAWRSRDGGAHWYPIVKGIGATVCLTVIADPRTQGRVYVGLGDWSLLVSADSLATVQNTPPPSGSFAYSTAIDESTSPSTIFQAASPRQDSASFTSKIYRNPDDLGGSAWLDTGFSVANAIVTGLAVVYNGATRILVATTSAGEVWRKNGDGGTWTKLLAASQTPSGGLNLASTDTTPFARKLGRGELYMYDRSTGVWRSKDYGATWVRIWSHASGNSDQAGWVAVHPTDATKLYVSDHTSVYLITNANTCGQDGAAVTTIGAALGARGPMAVDPANLKIGVCDITATPRFWESPLSPISWSDKGDQLYQNAVAAPQWLSYDQQGHAIIALSGNGVIMQQASGTTLTAPQVSSIPAISGQPVGGTVLRAVDGAATGNPAPTISARRWKANGVQVGTGTTYTVPTNGSIDGETITLEEDFTNSQGTATGTSAATAAVTQPPDPTPVWSVEPTVTGQTGNGESGDTVTGHNGTVSPGSVTAQKWQQSPTNLPGSTATDIPAATATTLALDDTLVGAYYRYVPHAVNGATAADEPSQWYGPVAAAPSSDEAPANTTLPSISVNVTTLTIDDGEWTGSPVPDITRQLRHSIDQGASWQTIDGATGPTYTVPAALYGAIFDVVVTATNSVDTASATSAATAPVSAPGFDVTVISTDQQEIVLRIRQRSL